MSTTVLLRLTSFGKIGGQWIFGGPVTFQIYWPPGPVAPGAWGCSYIYIFKCVITLCIWIMIIIPVFVLCICTCITVSDFIFLRTRVYHVDRRDYRYWRGCVAKDFITHVTHHAAVPMQPQRRHFCIEMALQLNLIICNRQLIICNRYLDAVEIIALRLPWMIAVSLWR